MIEDTEARHNQACKEACLDTDSVGQDIKDVVLTAVCGNQALFGAIGAAGTYLMIGTESLTESFVTAENGFSSDDRLAGRISQLHQGYTLCYLEGYWTEFETSRPVDRDWI